MADMAMTSSTVDESAERVSGLGGKPIRGPECVPLQKCQTAELRFVEAGFAAREAREITTLLETEGVRLGHFLNMETESQQRLLTLAFPGISNNKLDRVLRNLAPKTDSAPEITEDLPADASETVEPETETTAETSLESSLSSTKRAREPLAALSPSNNVGVYTSSCQPITNALQHLDRVNSLWESILSSATDLIQLERKDEELRWEEENKIYRATAQRLVSNKSPMKTREQKSAAPLTGRTKNNGKPAVWEASADSYYEMLEKVEEGEYTVSDVEPVVFNQRPKKVLAPASNGQKSLSPSQGQLAKSSSQGQLTKRVKGGEVKQTSKADYRQLISTQMNELQHGEKMHKKYMALLDRVLENQKELQREVDLNPWEMISGLSLDKRARYLKRQLMVLMGAAPPPENPETELDRRGKLIADELDRLTQLVSEQCSGLVSLDELERAVGKDVLVKLQLQTLKINIALSRDNKLITTNRVQRAWMQHKLMTLFEMADANGSGYVELEEIIDISRNRPEIKIKFAKLGMHVDEMFRGVPEEVINDILHKSRASAAIVDVGGL